MRKFYLPLLAASMAFSLQAANFEIEETFDDASHFTASSQIPDGWAVGTEAFARQSTADAGFQAKSGTYLFGHYSPNGGVFFTPLKEVAAGRPYKIEFSTALPAGREDWWTLGLVIYASPAQNADNMTEIGRVDYQQISSWRDLSYTFTPETDGEWCFAIRAERYPEWYAPCGAAWFDDFFITGTEPGDEPVVLEPNPDYLDDCVELPYKETFSDESHYLQEHNVPDGWATSGSVSWFTAGENALPAQEGSWYLMTTESMVERDDRAYTPFFNLVADREYTISFYTHFDGYIVQGQPRTATLHFTVGTEQEADFHPVRLRTVSRTLDASGHWEQETVSFTPPVSGPYCFAFMLEGPARSGWVAVDAFNIGSAYDLPRPEPAFAIGGIYSWNDNTLLAFGDTPVPAYNLSAYADSYAWTSDASADELENGDAHISFASSGDYTLSLAATNARGTRSTSQEITVTRLNDDTDNIPLLHYNPTDVTVIERGSIPSWPTDPNGLDYVSGFNHYYRTIAQRYDLPANGTIRPSLLVFYLANLRYAQIGGPDAVQQFDEPFTITIYGSDARGCIDPSRVLYREETTMAEVFGYQFIGGSTAPALKYQFKDAAEISGTVYLAFEFSDGMLLDAHSNSLGRSFFSLRMTRGRRPEASFYVKSTAELADRGIAAGEWHPVSDYGDDCRSLGLDMTLYADYRPNASGITDTAAATAVFSAAVDGGQLRVTGANGFVAVYSVDGRLLRRVAADGADAVVIDIAALPAGIYVAATEGATVKFIK